MTQHKTHSEPQPISAFQQRLNQRLRQFRELGPPAPGPNPLPRPDREKAQRRLAAAGVPDDAADTLDDPDRETTPALRAAFDWWQGESRCLLLLGGVGLGKTVAAAWCVREAIAEELAVQRPSGNDHLRPDAGLFVLASTVARMSLYGKDAHEHFEQLCRARLLVLDDFGREKLSEPAAALFDELLTRRLGSRRCRTVVTSNLLKVPLAERVGERIADRFAQHADSRVFDGMSLRRR